VEAVKDLAQNRLAGYKRPKQYEVVDVLPRTATGKVQRNRIPDLLGGG
jgi:acyl-CoA synthetase (AMP-forming)/AMP-acid ligase II